MASPKLQFWDNLNVRNLRQVWYITSGNHDTYWTTFNAFSQLELAEYIRHNSELWISEIQTHFIKKEQPWIIAAKKYLWTYPLDAQWAINQRELLGPIWYGYIRANTDDWEWLYANRERFPRVTLMSLLAHCKPHPIGGAIAVELPPIFDGENMSALQHDITSEPTIGILKNYMPQLLHADQLYHIRYRAILVCLYYQIQNATNVKAKCSWVPILKSILDNARLYLGLSNNRMLWKDYDKDWVQYARPKKIKSLSQWDTAVKEFTASDSWQTRLTRKP